MNDRDIITTAIGMTYSVETLEKCLRELQEEKPIHPYDIENNKVLLELFRMAIKVKKEVH